MPFFTRWSAVWLAAIVLLCPGPARADQPGQNDLDEATRLKVSAQKLEDWDE